MLRDDFIAQMIAELTRQKDIDENSFNYPRVCSPKEIFQSLCFDFPIISAAELLILSDHVSEFAASSSYDQLSNNFSLTDKFLENLKYLSGSPDRSGEIEREKAISSLCAAVFLRLPVRLLSMSRRELSSFFCCLSSSPESQSGCYDPDFIPFESPLLSWQQICSLYRHFVLQGTASLLSNIEVTMLVWNSNSKIISSDSKGHMVALSEAISRIQWDRNSGKSSKKHEFDLLTLEQCFVFNCEKASKADDVHADSTTNIDLLDTAANDDITNANGEVSESSFISSVAKDVWVHLSFLCRDLLVHYPEIINHSSALPSVLTALLPPNICRGPSSSFPTAPECMFVLILSGVISGITTTPPSLPSHNTLQGASEEGGTTAMVLQDSHERLLLRVSKSLDARTKLCKYLEASSPSLLATAVGICERMSRGSTNCDGAVLLCDISLLYTTDMKYAIPHPHEHLIATRAISALAQMWISAASSHFKVIETADNSFIPSSSATGMHAVASRLIQTISVICLQRTETTVFILKIPKFATSVFQACQQWRRISKKTGDPTDSEQEENDYLLLPGDAIGLLTAMSLAAANLPSSSLECSFETLHECLQSALSVIETKICLTSVSSTTSSLISAAEDKRCGEMGTILTAPGELITEPVRTHVVTRIGRRARRQSTIPRGLVTSLKLVTDENSGARALRAVSAGTGSQHVRAQSVVLTLRSWSAGVLKNSYAARCNSRLVATRGNLPTPSSGRKKESGDMDVSLESSTDICIDSPADSGVGTECGINNGTHPNCLQLDAEILETNGAEITTVADKDEDEDDVCGSIEYEEARRLLKSLQAVLQGFSSNKTD